jgi:hypothetical protein
MSSLSPIFGITRVGRSADTVGPRTTRLMIIQLDARDTEALERAAAKSGTNPQSFALRAIRERIVRIEKALRKTTKTEEKQP